MNNQHEQLAVRTVAVEHHHAEAKRFVDWYEEMAKSRFANAFAYGRHKIDVLLDETLKEQQLAHAFWMLAVAPENTSIVRMNLDSLSAG